MSNASDSSTFSSNANGSRFNRSFFIRFIAVVLFLGLGTFAVSQSLQSKSGEEASHDHANDHVHSHDNKLADENKETSPKQDGKFVIATPKIDGNEFAPKKRLTTTPRVEKFEPTGTSTPKTADLRPSVVTREKNLVAKPAVVKQEPGGRFNLNPRNTNLSDVTNSAATELKQDALNLGNSIAEKSNQLLDNTTQSLSDLNLPNRNAASSDTTTESPFRVDTEGFAPRPTPAQPAATTQRAQPPAGFDPNRTLAPLRAAPQDNRDTAKSDSGPGPRPERMPLNQNAASSSNQNFNSNFNVQSPRQNAMPNANINRNSTPPATNLRTSQPQGPGNLAPLRGSGSQGPAQPSPFQRAQSNSNVPAMQASTTRPIPSPAGGVRTLPTPGEKNLEGTRTPTLTVQRIAPREIQLNTPANFEIIVRNVGNIAANNVRIDDRIPTGAQLLEASPQPTQNAGGAVQWNIGDLAPGQERRIKLKLNPTQPGEIGSVAQVSFGTFSSVRTLVTKPELEITHSAPSKSLIGDQVPLDIVVTNKGNGPATKVIIQEDIPSQLEYSDGFRQIEYEIGTLAPGQSRKLQLVLKAANIGTLRNVISANAAGGLSSQHGINMEIVAPKLVARSNGPRRRFLRREATHQFEVQNNGTAPATNVELMAKLPPGLKYVSSNNRGQFDAATNAVYWSLAELDPSVAASVELTTVPVSTGDQPINFTAVADLKQKATTDAALSVEHLVDVFFDIDDVTDHIEVGSDTKYQVRIVNQGTKTATNVRLVLDMPTGMRPKDVEGGLQSQIQGQRVVFAPITSMNPGDEIKVAINATGVAPGEHKVIASMQTDGRQTNVQKEETTQVYSDR